LAQGANDPSGQPGGKSPPGVPASDRSLKLRQMGRGHLYSIETLSRVPLILPKVLLTCAACALAMRGSLRAADEVAGQLITLNDNGGWCWFQDERAIVDTTTNKLIVSSAANGAGTGGASRDGDIEVAALDLSNNGVTRFTLHDQLQADDHDSAALLRLPDGRYVASYSRHSTDSLTHVRISTNPGDISSWAPEITVTREGNATYSNLYRLSADGGKLYDISRTLDLDAHVMTSTDGGQNWTLAGRLLDWPKPVGDPKYTGTDGSRPYVRYASNGVDEIAFITSEDHPRAYDNSIYFGIIKNGKVYGSFGNVIDDNIFDGNAKKPNDYTQVWSTDTSSLGHAWATDLQLDAQNNPYALFTARANDTDTTDHRFLYARFDGSQWNVHEIAKAGGFLYSGENDYTGLGALDPSNPDRLFISTKIDPRTNVAMPHYEIFQGVTADGGANWQWSPITFNSTVDNIRPIVPKWDADHTAILWTRGTYTSYTSYDLDIVGLTAITPLVSFEPADFNRDGKVDHADFVVYMANMHTSLSGLSPDEARSHGDLNGDGLNDYNDLLLFKAAYDATNGAGSFVASIQVPEGAASAGLWISAFGWLYLMRTTCAT
jgi:hypothetical protein